MKYFLSYSKHAWAHGYTANNHRKSRKLPGQGYRSQTNDGWWNLLTFLIIITRNGSLMPSVFFFSEGQEMNVVDTFVPMISSTELWMSASVILLMCPFLTWPESQICRGFELNMAKLDVLACYRRAWHTNAMPRQHNQCKDTYPIEYRMERNPLWKVFWNIFEFLWYNFILF